MRLPLVLICDQEEYDISTCDELEAVLELTYDVPDVIVDMSQVKYIDSTCLTKLATMRKTRAKAGFPPAQVIITSSVILRLFAVTRFDTIWPIFDSVEAAMSDT